MTTLEWLLTTLEKEYAISAERLYPDASLEALGIDSLGMMELFFSVEDQFKITVPQAQIDLKTIGEVAHYIDTLIAHQQVQVTSIVKGISMSQYNIAVVVGSLRKESFNRSLATAIAKLAPPEFHFTQLEIGDLPLYNQDDDDHMAPSVLRLKAAVAAADGVMFATPEYNRSIPGVLKNALDHASRPYGQSAWAGKPAGILGVSVGTIGTATAQQHLRNILAYLDMPTLGQPEAYIQVKEQLFDEAGNIGEGSRQFMQSWMDRFAAWVIHHGKTHTAANNLS